MNYDPAYHPKSFLPKLILGKIWFNLSGIPYRNNDLLVLNYHSTPGWLIQEFENQVRFFSTHFNLASPGALTDFYNGKDIGINNNKPSVLFTFDDGLRNNLNAAAVLEKYNARGLFFLVPGFYKSPASSQKSYYLENIRKAVNFNIDKTEQDVTALSSTDIRSLLQNGHGIGSHSLTHTMHRDDDTSKTFSEVVTSKEVLEQEFGISVEDFCAPFDSLRSTGKSQMSLIKKHYSRFHSTFPGSNFLLRDRFFIRRTNVECWWPADVIKFALSSFEWKRWQSKRDLFRQQVLEV